MYTATLYTAAVIGVQALQFAQCRTASKAAANATAILTRLPLPPTSPRHVTPDRESVTDQTTALHSCELCHLGRQTGCGSYFS